MKKEHFMTSNLKFKGIYITENDTFKSKDFNCKNNMKKTFFK